MATVQSNRITARINFDQLELLNDAVKLSGSSSINNFILTSALAEAKRIVIEDKFLKTMKERESYAIDELDEDVLVLNKTEALELFAALENPEHSNSNLRALINSKRKALENGSKLSKARKLLGIDQS